MKYKGSRQLGFTLIELMVVVSIIGIIATLVYPSYQNVIMQTRRTTAKSCLTEYAQYMERFYASNFAYDKYQSGEAFTLPALACATEGGLNQYYSFSVADLTRSTFTISATPLGTQAKDSLCGTFSYNQEGVKSVSVVGNSTTCW